MESYVVPPPIAVRRPAPLPGHDREGMRVVIALLLVAGLAVTVHLPAAQASAPVPATPTFTAAIDPYPGYDAEDTCSATAKPGVVAFRDLLVRTYGSRWNNIVRSCSGSVSGHEEGRSLDFRFLASDSAQLAQANAVLGWLLATDKYGNRHANARRLGLMYVQFNNKMWRGYNANAGWLPQTVTVGGVKRDCATLGATYVTSCHRDHIHFSFGWDGAYKRTSFFLGRLPCGPPLTTNTTRPTVPSAPTRFVAVPAAVVLDTASGLGTPAGACSLAATVPYDVSVTGRGGGTEQRRHRGRPPRHHAPRPRRRAG
jgi:hypothetical protein